MTETDKTYRLRFAYAKNPKSDEPLKMKVNIVGVTNLTVTASVEGTDNTLVWQLKDVVFVAKSSDTRVQFESLSDLDQAVMLDSVRLDEVTPTDLYAVFSELENLARESMKFGDAPYAKEEEQVLFSGFEGAPVGLVKTNDVVDGWTVNNAKVRIIKNSRAHSGSYYSRLSHDDASPVSNLKLLGYWDFDNESEIEQDKIAKDSFAGIVGTVNGHIVTAMGETGTNNDKAIDLGASPNGKWVSIDHSDADGNSWLKPASDANQITVVLWQKLHKRVSSSTFWFGAESAPNGNRNVQAHIPWGSGVTGDIYFDTAGCCGVGETRIHKAWGGDYSQWHHFAFIKDGDHKTIWIDGELFHEGENTRPLFDDWTVAAIGSNSAGHSNLAGIVDDFAVFASALSEADIVALAGGTNPDELESSGPRGGAIWRDLPTAVGQDYRLSFATQATGDDAEYVLGGVVTNRVEGTVTLTSSIPKSSGWVTNKIRFTAARSSTPLTIRTESSAVRLDTIELIGPGPHNLAEEPLDVLNGERAMGDWVLEVRDHRVGPDDADTEIEPMLVSWYIKIMGSEAEDTEAIDSKGRNYTRDDTAEALEDGKKVRGRISEDEINYWTVETCEDSTKLTIELSSGKKRNNAKLSLLASYGGFPSGDTDDDDYVQVDMDDSYYTELVLDDSGHLPLQPGELLYLTVQKTDTNVTQRALYDILAKWDGKCGDDSSPDSSAGLFRLASAEGSESFRVEPGVIPRYVWSIPAGTKSALLEVTGLAVDADIQLLSTDGRHFRNSINLGQVPEQIVLREGDYIPSLGGDWVVQATNVDGGQNEFTLHTTLADEQGHLISSQPIELEIEGQFWPPTVRLDWPSVPGERYVLESSANLIDWVPVHEQVAGSSGIVFHAERSWFGERYYRVKQLTDGR